MGIMKEEYAPGSFILGQDEFTGTVTKMHINHDGVMHFEDIAEIDDIAEQARQERNESSRTAKQGDMVKVASLPMMVYLDLTSRGILRDRAEMRKWLASDEALPYRTHWMKS
jgi:hypothetical protein